MSAPDSAAPLVKGASMLGFFKFVKSRPGGEALLNKVLAALPPETAAVCRRKVIAVADYPYRVFVDLIRAIDKVVGKGDLTLCRKLGEYAAGRDVSSVLKTVTTAIKAEDMFRASGLLWKSYHLNSGEMKIADPSPEHTVIRISNFPQMDPAHCRLMEGYFSQGLRETGVSLTEEIHEVKCMGKGDSSHDFHGRYRVNPV